jgi:hypothetical protein
MQAVGCWPFCRGARNWERASSGLGHVVGIRAAARWTQALPLPTGSSTIDMAALRRLFCGLDGLVGLMLAASPVFGAKPP